MTRTARFWLREIWGPQWDGERRALLMRHFWSYARHPAMPPRHLPGAEDEASFDQAAFCAQYWQRIDGVQHHAARAQQVRLTYRPIGKNLRLVGTAIRRNADRGVATTIDAAAPGAEMRALAARGHAWHPWLWSRSSSAEATGSADAAWAVFFERPAWREPIAGETLVPPAPPAGPPHGHGALSASQLHRVLKLAVATDYAFSPRQELVDEAARLRRAMAWPEGAPVLGLHIRRSDAASSEPEGPRRSNRASFAIARYLDEVDALCDTYGIRHVFLATESEQEIRAAAALRPRLTFLTIDHDRSLFPSIEQSPQFIEEMTLRDPARAHALARTAILDLLMFRECGAFVGAFNSEFSVLAWLLCIAGQRRAIPYVSLSAPQQRWRFHPYDALLNTRNNCPLELYHW
jgi:hypothetical protein